MTDHDIAQKAARTRAGILDGLARAERKLFTRPVPKSARARMKFLRTREKGSTKAVAERLGVSPRTVQRYLAGASTKPNRRLQEALAQETESEWQPQVRAQGRQRAASSGMIITCRAYFGFGPEGTSDTGRVRDIMVDVPAHHAAAILAAQETGATDSDLQQAVAEAIADVYFRREGGGRAGLEVRFSDLEWLNISF
ncbi:telomere-protecting terminal protein Tpg [Streptomyces tsukubensis]|uniref:telomere-protecting terminal protein Tpg n=1 Tax=Streptomyces tsukubensis TaxID=83656 RepID=UPI00344FE956